MYRIVQSHNRRVLETRVQRLLESGYRLHGALVTLPSGELLQALAKPEASANPEASGREKWTRRIASYENGCTHGRR